MSDLMDQATDLSGYAKSVPLAYEEFGARKPLRLGHRIARFLARLLGGE